MKKLGFGNVFLPFLSYDDNHVETTLVLHSCEGAILVVGKISSSMSNSQ